MLDYGHKSQNASALQPKREFISKIDSTALSGQGGFKKKLKLKRNRMILST